MKIKKIPTRTCVINRSRHPKKELIRITCTQDKKVSVDPTGKAHGHGAYILLNPATVEKAKKSKILDKIFETPVPDSIYEELMGLIKEKDK